jgi:hypothetical protein
MACWIDQSVDEDLRSGVQGQSSELRATVPAAPADLDCEAFARRKIAPMLRGLFPAAEQRAVLDIPRRAGHHPPEASRRS